MKNFKELGLSPELLGAVEDLGFETPSEIQAQTIPLLLQKDTDMVGLAQTGTGKTAAFGIPMLEKISLNSKQTQGLILAPTRELCLQITDEMARYAKYHGTCNIVAIYGGASISAQEKNIRRGAQIIVATPGRMKDMLKRKIIDIGQLDYCVLDEADEMLNMGFYEDITAILSYAPDEKKTWLFSATMPQEVSRIAAEFMTDPEEITVGAKNEGTTNVSHAYYLVASRDRYKALRRIADSHPDIFAVVFCRTKRGTQKVAERLAEDGYNAAAIHGDLSQNQRDLVMKSFRHKQVQLLVATDVAARGIDVSNITHVINYQLPDETEVYTHRSGRTGRAGKEGASLVLVTKGERSKIKKIEKIINQKFTQKLIPSGEDICRTQLLYLAKTIKDTPINSEIEQYLPAIRENFEALTKEELIKTIISREFGRFHKAYKEAPDLNKKAENKGDIGQATARFFINMGERDGYDWKKLKDFLREELNLTREEISQVEVKKSFSFFNTDANESKKVFDFFENYYFRGRQIRVEKTEKRSKKKHPKKRSSKKGSRRIPKGDRPTRKKGGRRVNIKSSINRRKKKKGHR